MTTVTRNRLLAVAALAVAAGGLAFVALADLGDNLVYYWKPSEVLSHGEDAYGPTIRLGGVVRRGSIKWDPGTNVLAFDVADDVVDGAPFVKVQAAEIPPQMFRENIGVVVEGTYSEAGVFTSNRLMVNHSNEYKAPHEGQDPKEWNRTLNDTASTRNP